MKVKPPATKKTKSDFISPTILCCLLVLLLAPYFTKAQGGQKWSVAGNSINSNDFLGSTNLMPLSLRVNNVQQMLLNTNGSILFNNYTGTGNGLLFTDNTGLMSRLNFSGNAGDVLFGNGTWGSLATSTGWTINGNFLFSSPNYNVGIGVSNPTAKLSVNGNISATGGITATSVNIVNIMQSGQVTAGNLAVNGIATFANKIQVARITPLPGDSVIRFGDSSIYISTLRSSISPGYRIYWSRPSNPTLYAGLGIGNGRTFAKGTNALAIGTDVSADGQNAIGIGSFVNAATNSSIVIGNGVDASNYLTNNLSNSLIVGFNSNVPTFFVGPSNGVATTGKVGIGTNSPQCKLEVVDVGSADICAFSVGSSPVGSSIVWAKNYLLSYGIGVDPTGIGHIYEDINVPSHPPVMSFDRGNVGIGTSTLKGSSIN